MRAWAWLTAPCPAGLRHHGCIFGPAARAYTPLPEAAPASPESGRSVLNKPPQQPAKRRSSDLQPADKINPPAQMVGNLPATCKNNTRHQIESPAATYKSPHKKAGQRCPERAGGNGHHLEGNGRKACQHHKPHPPAIKCTDGGIIACDIPGPLDNGQHRFNAKPADQIAKQPPQHRSEEHTSELQSRGHLVCRLLPE